MKLVSVNLLKYKLDSSELINTKLVDIRGNLVINGNLEFEASSLKSKVQSIQPFTMKLKDEFRLATTASSLVTGLML